jgi:hypothetical protein
MIVSFNSIFGFLLVMIILFHKRILRSQGFNPERARDKFTIFAVAWFLSVPTIPVAQLPIIYYLMFFLGGLILAIPAGVLSWKHTVRNIKGNVLYFDKGGLPLYAAILGVIIVGAIAGYLGFMVEFVWFGWGWTTMSFAFLVFLIVKHEKKVGPLMLVECESLTRCWCQ